jgi:hypothetical protein
MPDEPADHVGSFKFTFCAMCHLKLVGVEVAEVSVAFVLSGESVGSETCGCVKCSSKCVTEQSSLVGISSEFCENQSYRVSD